jgi:hypothetical protein
VFLCTLGDIIGFKAGMSNGKKDKVLMINGGMGGEMGKLDRFNRILLIIGRPAATG